MPNMMNSESLITTRTTGMALGRPLDLASSCLVMMAQVILVIRNTRIAAATPCQTNILKIKNTGESKSTPTVTVVCVNEQDSERE